mmetsp:Transcript_20579/g.57204  ORF Transcript_20579/g.57204 Transcript_20579/m.57204 type:complete len:88 (+) Transcript_20579:3182-3445(+)
MERRWHGALEERIASLRTRATAIIDGPETATYVAVAQRDFYMGDAHAGQVLRAMRPAVDDEDAQEHKERQERQRRPAWHASRNAWQA